MSINPVGRRSDIVVQELENEVLIYDLISNKAFCLNETSAVIWQMCDGTKTVSEISQAVGKKFRTALSEEFVWLALDQFKKEGLIENEFKSVFEGMTRREVIRKVGFASMVALPVVASIIAPTPVIAQSCITAFQPCSPAAGACCPQTLCAGAPGGAICTCMCSNPGQCLTQSSCPSTTNCNPSGVCAP